MSLATETAILGRRIAALEKQLAGFREITGTDPSSGAFIVTVLSINRDTITGGYFITFVSQPGDTYQIQSSNDAVAWSVADSSVNASAAPDLTSTWLSPPYAEDVIIYFRVRRYPRTLPLVDPNPGVTLSPPLADTPTLQQILAQLASLQAQFNALTYDPDTSTRLREIRTPTQLATALAEDGELILRLRDVIELPSGSTVIPADKVIEFGLHWFEDSGGSTIVFNGKCVAERYMVFSGFTAGDIVGTFGAAEVYPEWWGLEEDRHDIAINAAVQASPLSTQNFGITVSLTAGRYSVARPIDCAGRYVTLKGAGSGKTSLTLTSAWTAVPWKQCEVWGDPVPDVPNHAAAVWIGGETNAAQTYRNQVVGIQIDCYNASFAHRASKYVSGISAKGGVEECSIIDDVVVTSASGFGIGFGRHKHTDASYNAATVNGLKISNIWITGATKTDFVALHFSQWTNNCRVDTATLDVGLAKSVSSLWGTGGAPGGADTTIYDEPEWVCDYPQTAIVAQGNLTLSNIHIEGAVTGAHIKQNSGANNVAITNLKTFAMMDRGLGVYELDGFSGADPSPDTGYFDYGCAVLIGKAEGDFEEENNLKDCVTLTAITAVGGCPYLVRDAVYGVERTMFDTGQFPAGELAGRIAFYTRGNAYTGSGGGATYNKAAPSTDRTYFMLVY